MKIKFKHVLVLPLVLFQLMGSAQDLPTLSLGAGINSYEANTDDAEFLNSDFGIHVGFFKPLLKKDRFNLGLNASGAYSFTEGDFSNLQNVIPIAPMEGLTVETTSNSVNQSLIQFGAGPQLNFKLVDNFWVSPILHFGYFNFNQDELVLTQESDFNDRLFETEAFRQDAINEGSFFTKPALRLSYQISKHWNIWGESSYFIAEINSTQNELVPPGEPNELGQYFFDQILGDPTYETREQNINLNNFGISFGLAYSFGKDVKNNTSSSRSGKFKEGATIKDSAAPNAPTSNPPKTIAFSSPSIERKERERRKQKLIAVLPENNSHFESLEEIQNFSWELLGDKLPNPQFTIRVTRVDANQQTESLYSATTSRTSISAGKLFKTGDLEEGQYRWQVTETTTGTKSNIRFFNFSSCEIDFSITNEEIECLGYEGADRKFKICFDSNYTSTSGDLTFADASSGLSVFDQSYTALSYTLVSPNPSLQTQTGATPSTVSYCFEVTVPAGVTEIGFGLQGDDLDPSPVLCQPGVSLNFDELPDCICDECEDIRLSFSDYTISMNGNTGNQFNINGNLNVNVPVYGIEVQIQSYSYSANPSACTDGVSSIEESGMILMPGTSINGSTSLQLANEDVSGSPNSNDSATKNITYSSSSGLTGAIPMNLTIGLPGPLPGLDPDCCRINYSVCVKIKVIYDENNCKSCVFTHCFTFNNQ